MKGLDIDLRGKREMAEHRGILLIGPTGSGKTPLGDLIGVHGLDSRSMVHFDFGVQLRSVESRPEVGALLDPWERDLVHHVLKTGSLLEDDAFSIAEKLLFAFLNHDAEQSYGVVLNGMPRHVGQAIAVERLIGISEMISLEKNRQFYAHSDR